MTYVVHLVEELGRVVEGIAVLGDGAVELVPLAFDVVDLASQPARVALAVAYHAVGGVREAGHLAVDQVRRFLELFERLCRQADRRQRAAVGSSTRVQLTMKFIEFAVQLKYDTRAGRFVLTAINNYAHTTSEYEF